MVRNSWTDLAVDGRRLERVIKLCETEISNHLNSNDPDKHDLVLAYIDRLIRATNQKEKLADTVLGISHLRKLAEKKYDQPKVYLAPPPS